MAKEFLLLRNGLSPGDGVMLAYAIKSLKAAHGDKFCIDVETPFGPLFEGLYEDKTLTRFGPNEKNKAKVIETKYDTIHRSNQALDFYMCGILRFLEDELGLRIPPADYSGFLSLRKEETMWYSAVYEKLGRNVPFWVVNAGWKNDYTAKQWPTEYYQKVIDTFPEIWFVQIGAKEHNHPNLVGDNVINLIGKTDLRQLIRLIWNAYGVLTPCSMAMLLAYSLPAHPIYGSKSRACIAIGGGREPNHWHQGPNSQYLHTCGMIDCCEHGGCWKARVVPLKDGEKHDNSLCKYPETMPSGQVVGRCMAMIDPGQVISRINMYISSNFKVQELLKPDIPVKTEAVRENILKPNNKVIKMKKKE